MSMWTRVGIIILVIGVSVLGGTLYRSNETTSFGNPRIDIAPNSWSISETLEPDSLELFHFLSTPREFRLEVMSTAAVDVYILDSEGIKQWEEDQTVKPVWAFKETRKDIHIFQFFKRDKFTLLLYNPTNENVTSEWHIMIYGIEKDLLYASVVVIIAGVAFTTVSIMINRKQSSKLLKFAQ